MTGMAGAASPGTGRASACKTSTMHGFQDRQNRKRSGPYSRGKAYCARCAAFRPAPLPGRGAPCPVCGKKMRLSGIRSSARKGVCHRY